MLLAWLPKFLNSQSHLYAAWMYVFIVHKNYHKKKLKYGQSNLINKKWFFMVLRKQ